MATLEASGERELGRLSLGLIGIFLGDLVVDPPTLDTISPSLQWLRFLVTQPANNSQKLHPSHAKHVKREISHSQDIDLESHNRVENNSLCFISVEKFQGNLSLLLLAPPPTLQVQPITRNQPWNQAGIAPQKFSINFCTIHRRNTSLISCIFIRFRT